MTADRIETAADLDAASWNFTSACPWGCEVTVTEGKEQPHTCAGASAIVDALRVTGLDGTVLELSERLARTLDPTIRERLFDAWAVGVADGRSGEKFYGLDEMEHTDD